MRSGYGPSIIVNIKPCVQTYFLGGVGTIDKNLILYTFNILAHFFFIIFMAN